MAVFVPAASKIFSTTMLNSFASAKWRLGHRYLRHQKHSILVPGYFPRFQIFWKLQNQNLRPNVTRSRKEETLSPVAGVQFPIVIDPERYKILNFGENNFWSQLSLTSVNPSIMFEFGDSKHVNNLYTKKIPHEQHDKELGYQLYLQRAIAFESESSTSDICEYL